MGNAQWRFPNNGKLIAKFQTWSHQNWTANIQFGVRFKTEQRAEYVSRGRLESATWSSERVYSPSTYLYTQFDDDGLKYILFNSGGRREGRKTSCPPETTTPLFSCCH